MNRIEFNNLLAQMEAMKSAARGGSEVTGAAPPGRPAFADLLARSIDSVNDMQQQSSGLQQAFEKGEAGVDIAQVMLAVQKASLSFQTMTQVRNKLLEAYQDIKNMPI